jgi:hypothetical protein
MKCVFRSAQFCVAAVFLLAFGLSAADQLRGEVCITQSQMKPADRDAIAATARNLAAKVQSDDAAGLRAQTIPEYAKDASAMTALVANTAPKVKDAPVVVDQVYVLDASNLKTAADGTNQDAQFFCSLNKSIAEANFLIPALPPGRYALAIVNAQSAKAPWRLSFLLRQDAAQDPAQTRWSMAGFYPRALTAAGHDGLWYWTRARDLVKAHQLWSAYLYYEEAQTLLQPTGFTSSTHLDKLRREAIAGAPPALSDGISVDAPLVVKSANGAEYRFTALGTDDSLGADKVDVVVHLAPEPAPDAPPASDAAKKTAAKSQAAPPQSPRDRNNDAMAALLAAYPELRNNFHGIWVFAEEPGKNPFVTEEPMTAIH